MLSSFTLYLFREAMLISELSARRSIIPFDSIETLLLNSDYKIGVMPTTYFEDFFRNSKDPIIQRAWIERVEPYLDYYDEILQGMYVYWLETYL